MMKSMIKNEQRISGAYLWFAAIRKGETTSDNRGKPGF